MTRNATKFHVGLFDELLHFGLLEELLGIVELDAFITHGTETVIAVDKHASITACTAPLYLIVNNEKKKKEMLCLQCRVLRL
jgi:hypothetical protein